MSDNVRLTGQQAKTVGKQTAAMMTATRNLARRTVFLAGLVFAYQLAGTIEDWDTLSWWWLTLSFAAMGASAWWVIDGIRTSTVCTVYIRQFKKWDSR